LTDITPVLEKSSRWLPVAKLTDRFFNLPSWKATVWHVDSTESAILPYLAEMLGITETAAWQSAQSDQERKALIQSAHTRFRTRGTPAGLIREAAEAGGQVRRIIAPPNKTFLSAAASVAERNAWLNLHPELRIYTRRLPGTKQVAMLGSEFLGGKCYPARSEALVRSRLRVTLVKNGLQTELESPDWQIASAEKQAITEVIIPSKAGHASFLGRPLRFVAATDASNRRIVLQDVALYQERTSTLGIRTLKPALEPIHADGEMVSEIRPANPGASYLGKFPRCLVNLEAVLAQYRRIKLFDPSAPVTRAKAASHLGYSRLTMPPHCAQVEVAFFGKRSPRIGRFMGQPVAAGDRAPLQRLLANMRLAARASDSIAIDTKTFRPVRSGHILAGSVLAGGVTNH